MGVPAFLHVPAGVLQALRENLVQRRPVLGCSGGPECLESGASPGIEPIDFVRGLTVGQFGVKRNRLLCPLAVLCFWSVFWFPCLWVCLRVSMTPMLLGLPVSVTLASGSCCLSRLLSVHPGRGPCWIGRNAGLGWPLPMLSRNRRPKPRPGVRSRVLGSLLFARPRAPTRKCMSKRFPCPC